MYYMYTVCVTTQVRLRHSADVGVRVGVQQQRPVPQQRQVRHAAGAPEPRQRVRPEDERLRQPLPRLPRQGGPIG